MSSGARAALREAGYWLMALVIAIGGYFVFNGEIQQARQQLLETAVSYWNHQKSHAGERRRPQPNQYGATDQQQANAHRQAEEEPQDYYGDEQVVLRADRMGHFETRAYIEGRAIHLLADTGATLVVLTYEDARKLGLTSRLRFTGRSQTANGIARMAPVMLEKIRIGGITVYDVQAAVAEKGRLANSLLGMSFINRLKRFEVSGNKLILVK